MEALIAIATTAIINIPIIFSLSSKCFINFLNKNRSIKTNKTKNNPNIIVLFIVTVDII